MAKRFIDTGFYKSPFVRGLKGALKGLYTFIICDCEGSGIWNFDLEAAELYTGHKITFKEFEDHFIKNGKAIDLKNGKFFFPDFIEEQYPTGLQEGNPSHKNFISQLKKFNLIEDPLKPLTSPLQGALVKVMVKVIVKGKEKEKEMVCYFKKTENISNSLNVSTQPNSFSTPLNPLSTPPPKKPKPEKPIELVYPFQDQSFLDYWKVWKKYKKEQHDFTYKGEISEQAALKELGELSNGNLELAKKLMQNAISKGYKGIFPISGTNPKSASYTDDELLDAVYKQNANTEQRSRSKPHA